MIINYLLTAYRHILKNKINALFKLGGLVLALFSFMIIAVYIFYQLSFDRYHQGYENIYRVNTGRNENGVAEQYGIAPVALGPMLHNRFPEVSAFTMMDIPQGSHVRYKNKVVKCGVVHADSTFFDVFTFNFIKGGTGSLSKPGTIVITESLALKIFKDEDPLQKLITVSNGKELFEVTAIVADMPHNAHFRVDAFIPFTRKADFSIDHIVSPVEFVDNAALLFLKFRDDARPELFAAKLESLLYALADKKALDAAGFGFFLQPLKDIYLDPPLKYEFTRKGSTAYLFTFSMLGIFLLVIASINYINLSVADFANRAREIGVRKVMGARKGQVIFQVALEVVFFCFCALVISVVLLYLLFPAIVPFIETNLSFSMLGDARVMSFIGFMLLVLIICATGLPAWWLSKRKIAYDLKGSHGPGQSASFGKVLLVCQFVISVICISATFTIGRQLDYIHTKDLGIDRENLLVMSLPEDFSVTHMQSFKQELKTIPGVVNVSNSSFRIGGGYWKDWYMAEVDGEMKSLELYEVFSDDDLLSTLGMRLIEGRFFNDQYPADSGAAFVINETAAKYLGWDDPVGKRILTHPEEKGKWDGTVVGVVADVNIKTLHEEVQPLVMRLPWQSDYPEMFIYVRIDGDAGRIIRDMNKKYSALVPDYPLELEFVNDFYNNRYEKENKAFSSLQFGTVIIILISSLGIFSLSVYISARRMKEFGIRKVLGATVRQITLMHIGHFVRFAALGNIIALPVSYWWVKTWLDNFAYRTGTSIGLFLVATVILFVMVVLSAAWSAIKAGRANPVETIKTV